MPPQEHERSHGITKHLTGVVIVLFVVFIAYFGLYFITAEYIDIGDSTPSYLLRYRIGTFDLDRFAQFFEPARRIDAAFIRRFEPYPLNLYLLNPQSDESLHPQ